jgi:hypothetical protein
LLNFVFLCGLVLSVFVETWVLKGGLAWAGLGYGVPGLVWWPHYFHGHHRRRALFILFERKGNGKDWDGLNDYPPGMKGI